MSKRLNLREFQQNLIDRLQMTDSSESRVSTLGVQIAGRNWLVDMADIGEVFAITLFDCRTLHQILVSRGSEYTR